MLCINSIVCRRTKTSSLNPSIPIGSRVRPTNGATQKCTSLDTDRIEEFSRLACRCRNGEPVWPAWTVDPTFNLVCKRKEGGLGVSALLVIRAFNRSCRHCRCLDPGGPPGLSHAAHVLVPPRTTRCGQGLDSQTPCLFGGSCFSLSCWSCLWTCSHCEFQLMLNGR